MACMPLHVELPRPVLVPNSSSQANYDRPTSLKKLPAPETCGTVILNRPQAKHLGSHPAHYRGLRLIAACRLERRRTGLTSDESGSAPAHRRRTPSQAAGASALPESESPTAVATPTRSRTCTRPQVEVDSEPTGRHGGALGSPLCAQPCASLSARTATHALPP